MNEIEWLKFFKKNLEVSLRQFTKNTNEHMGMRSATKASLSMVQSRLNFLESKQ